MNKRLQLAIALCCSVILSVACSTKPAAPEKPVPVVTVTSVHAKPAPAPKAETPKPAPSPEKPSVPAPKQKADDAKKAPPAPPPAPKKEDVAPQKKAETPKPAPAPEKVVKEEPLPPPAKTIKFRCAYWEKPETAYDIYVRQNGKFQRCQLFELVFSQTMTPEIDSNGTVTIYRKADGDYLPIFSIDPCGMDNLAAVILPKFNPDSPDGAYVQLLDLDEQTFPKGSIKIVNWSGKDINGDLVFRETEKKQHFTLRCGEFYVSDELSRNRDICNIRFFDEKNPERAVYESAFSLFRVNQTLLFVLKDETEDGFDFKMSKVR
ncbi:MAG: hypothetical protein IJW12_03595 [Opitutales bacterium]|nr:hypothetical protein [Opitutales bacterium]